MKPSIIAAALISVALTGCGKQAETPANQTNASAATPAAAGADWTTTASKTPAGGFVLGNPAAPVKLIEYGALTCSHCATFSAESATGLKAMIAKGTVSYEFRNFMLNIVDVPAAIVARCGGAAPFFQITEQLFASQGEWLGKTQSLTPADQAAMAKMTPIQIAAMLAPKLGLDRFVEQRGVPSAQVQACLADPKAIAELETLSRVGQEEFKISGTPTFIINGQKVEDTADWAKLEPALLAAGA